MKRILMLLFLMVSSLALVACGDDKVTLEWETMPKSVYALTETTAEATFQDEVKVKINGQVYTLKKAVELGATVTGFDTTSAGQKTVTVKYESLTITWSYVVGPVKVDEFEPSTVWYTANTSATTFTLMTEEDLFGLAELVNKDGVDFKNKTVKLGKDMDLSDKVWTPIGQGTRKADPVQITPNADMMIKAKRDFVQTTDYKEGVYEYIFLSSHTFAVRTSAQDANIEYFTTSSGKVENGNFFKGTFDGQNHKIKGLSDVGYTPTVTKIYANSKMVLKGYVFGLFGIVEGNVTIKNVVFENVAITGAYYDDSTDQKIVKAEIDSVGAAIGYVNKTDTAGNLVIENVKVLSGSITASNAAAGIVGRFYNTGTALFKDVENHANISVLTGGNHAGGIAGFGSGTARTEFNNAKNYGNITVATNGANDPTAGGILNGASNLFIINSSNFGNISGSVTDPLNPGYGLVGNNSKNIPEDNITNSLNFGTVK